MARNMFDLLGAGGLVVAGSKINLTVLPGNIDRLGLDEAKLSINQTSPIKELNPVTINDLSNSVYPKVLTLDVGGRKFKVSAHILREESGLFRHQLSERFTWTAEADGSYFIDASPALFEHLLDFMRRPNIFPLFWTKSNGFDYNLYHRLQAEAQYFQIDALHQWIKDKRYLKAIALSLSRPTVHEVYDIGILYYQE
ncbi:hypothetical protein EKO04_007608 [Ascochyta lentis]|uniref:BTB domain-containing protein n=1 Tax=Ascochyta lentis TaxID=205686 RepID=A0A8H7MH81_9PLEO|nr:hypothetical protein EKO04_007608 [Ascochyta lentis]